jgi:hypothetical protein
VASQADSRQQQVLTAVASEAITEDAASVPVAAQQQALRLLIEQLGRAATYADKVRRSTRALLVTAAVSACCRASFAVALHRYTT